MPKYICCTIVSAIFAILFFVQWKISKTPDYTAHEEKNVSIVFDIIIIINIKYSRI